MAHAEAKVAIEMVRFDIVGKQSGLSVADLLGGRVRDTIPLSFSIADPDFAGDNHEAAACGRHRACVVSGATFGAPRLVRCDRAAYHPRSADTGHWRG